MGFDNFRINRVDLNPFDRDTPPQNFSVNIAIIDKSPECLFPLAYQFNKDINLSDELLSNMIDFDETSFLCLGDVEKINKHKRLITLRNKSTVRYKHLIILSDQKNSFLGTFSQNSEFTTALQRLIEALKTNKKLHSRILALSINEKPARVPDSIKRSTKNSSEIHEIFDHKTSERNSYNMGQIRSKPSKRLFEIQLFADSE
ncbi:MAG: hypothetical protein VX777_08375 [Chlamydiota bacterium]|nr:hypothetical protein [Chlamydiota bacterium]